MKTNTIASWIAVVAGIVVVMAAPRSLAGAGVMVLGLALIAGGAVPILRERKAKDRP